MKIVKLSAKVSKITNDDIKRELQNIPSPERTLSLLNEAYGRKYIEAFYIASASPHNINDLQILKLIGNIIVANPQNPATNAIVDNILEFSKNIDPSIITKINGVAISNPAIASTIILHHNTQDNLIDSIIGHLHLNITTIATLESNQFLQAIINDLKRGNSWNNERSGLIMASRIVQYPQDSFITEISKYNLTPSVAGALINASRLYKAQNPELNKNLQANTNGGVEIAKLIYDEGVEQVAPNLIIPGLLVSMEKTKYQPYVQWIWNLIKKKMIEKTEWELQAFNSHYDGKNIIGSTLEMIPSIIPDLIDIIKSSKNLGTLKRKPIYEEIIHLGLSNPTYRAKTLELPEEYFRMIKMTKENQKIVEDHFNPKIEGYENLEELMGNKNDWYIKYSKKLATSSTI